MSKLKWKRPNMSSRKNASRVAIITICVLLAMKVVASVVTGSISIRADAIHSAIDLAGAIVGYICIRVSDKPPDKQHPFGHGKAENIAGTVIGTLILVAAGIIAYESVTKLIAGSTVEMVSVGIVITAVAITINLAVSWYTLRVSRATDSLAIEGTARDLFADVLSSAAVLVGLLLVSLTGIHLLDSIVALVVAGIIARTAFLTIRKSFSGLMDVSLPEDEEELIKSFIREHIGQVAGFHNVRTRKSGSERHVDLHLVVPQNASVREAHEMCDHLEAEIKEQLKNVSITIHVEPCDMNCEECPASCNSGKKSHQTNVARKF